MVLYRLTLNGETIIIWLVLTNKKEKDMITAKLSFDWTIYKEHLQNSCLFDRIPEDKYINVLACLQADLHTCHAGASIVNAGDENGRAGVLLEGELEEFIYDENGNPVVIRTLGSGAVFGAELACGNSLASQFYLDAVCDSKVLLLDFKALMSEMTLNCPYRMQVTANLLQEFADQITFFNTKVRILSQKKLRDKIKVYLQTQEISDGGVIHLSCTRNKLAEFLYVDRSALSRELCRMRDEGVLQFSGSRIKMLDQAFLAG